MEAIKPENSFLDLSKLSEDQIKEVGKILINNNQTLTPSTNECLIEGLPFIHWHYLHLSKNDWILSKMVAIKQELTYTQFLEMMGGETSADISILERTEYPGKDYQELFDHLHNEHGLTLLESEMSEIINLVGKLGGESKEVLQVENNGWIKAIAISHQKQMSSTHPHAIIGTIEDAIIEALEAFKSNQ